MFNGDADLLSASVPDYDDQPQPGQEWPRHCRNFNAAIDDANEICSHFCSDVKCGDCTPEEALHISTYNTAGELLSDGKADTASLRHHLDGVGQLGDGGGNENTPRYRLYFTSDDSTESCMRTPYIRSLLWHYQTPADVALAWISRRLGLGFQSYTEHIDHGATRPPSKILHCWLKYAAHLTKNDMVADLEFFSERMKVGLVKRSQSCSTAIHDPALYMAYDYTSGHCALLSTEYGTVFRALRQTCRDAAKMRVNDDPFVFFTVFLNWHLNAIRRTAVEWREQIYKLSDILMDPAMDRGQRYRLLKMFSRDRLAYGRMSDSMEGFIQDIDAISKAHLELCDALSAFGQRPVPRETVQWVEKSLERQKVAASQLVMLFRDCGDTAQAFAEIILGYSQLKNSYATEALAVDAKRDTQTMKTITYVTLLFLPSTFVSTVFSMGIFNFDSDMESDGHIIISRHGWVFLAVALPLTLVTLALAYLWMRIKGSSSPSAPPDEESSLDTTAISHFRVIRRKGKDGPQQEIALSDIPKKDLRKMLAAVSQFLGPGGDISAENSGVGISVTQGRQGPNGIEEEETVPLESAPREHFDLLKAELERRLGTDGTRAVDQALARPWYSRVMPRRRSPAAYQAAVVEPNATESTGRRGEGHAAASMGLTIQTAPSGTAAQDRLHRPPAAGTRPSAATSATAVASSPGAAAPTAASLSVRADRLHFES